MIENYLFDDITYKSINEYAFNTDYLTIVEALLDSNWNTSRDRIYYFFSKNPLLIKEGWKIHISASLFNSKEILKICIPILNNSNCSFKIIGDSYIHQLSKQKFYPRSESGKFITIYPDTRNDFVDLLASLYAPLKDYEGQFILTDKPYLDSKCIYYRYGSFINQFKRDSFDKKIPIFYNIEGKSIEDSRQIPYHPIVDDSFLENNAHHEQSILLSKYKVEKCLHMSNSGGVYLGHSLNQKRVVIKEGRSLLSENLFIKGIDARTIIVNEFDNLKQIQNLGISPKPIECFDDCDNTYLIEEFIPGTTLSAFMKENNPIYHGSPSQEDFIRYYTVCNKILISIISNLKKLNDEHIYYSDVNAENIIINCEDYSAKFIDFEFSESKKIIISKSKQINGIPLINNNILSILCYLLMGHENMLSFDTTIFIRTLARIENQYSFSTTYEKIYELLLKKLVSINKIIYLLSKPIQNKHVTSNESFINLKSILDSHICKFNHNSIIPRNPIADFPYEYAYGILGIPGFENNLEQIEQNFNNSKGNIPIGLINGWCGLIWKYIEVGKYNKASDFILKINKSKLFINHYSLGYGLAGYLMCCIALNIKQPTSIIMDIQQECVDYLCAKYDENKYFYNNNKSIPFGWGKGATGISLSLFYMYLFTKKEKYLSYAISLINDELSHIKHLKNSNGLYLPFASNDLRCSPYFFEGTSGLVSVITRINFVLKRDISEGLLNEMITAIHTPYSVNVGQFHGITGVAETFIDLYIFTNKKKYLDIAFEYKDLLQTYYIHYGDEIYLPSDQYQKVTFDFASGEYGVLAFLERLENPNQERQFFLDKFILEKGNI